MSGASDEMRVGLYGIGLEAYWPQFNGLKQRLQGYLQSVRERLQGFGAEVVDLGLVDSPIRAREAADSLRIADVEIVVLFISTYALSSTVLPVAQATGKPVIVLNLQPVPAIDYERFNQLSDRGVMTGEWLAHCQACCVPEVASVLGRAGIEFHLVTGHFADDAAWQDLEEWVRAAAVAKAMRENRLGVLGHYYGGMLDVYTDLATQSTTFGTHIDLIEMDELAAIRQGVTESEIHAKLDEFNRAFDVSSDCDTSELGRAARTSVALDRLVESHRLGSLAYYYEGEAGGVHEDIVTSVIAGNTLLTGRNVPVAGECEVKNAQAMKILDLLGAGGSFSEFYAMDFREGVVMLGHDGPGHFRIAEGPVGLVPLPVYHGKPGKGLSIQMSVKHGPVTLLSVGQNARGVFLLLAEGESVAGPVLHIGNTNSRYRFPLGVKDFINRWSEAGPSHHCAIGVGHVGGVIERLGSLVGVPVVRIC